MAYAVMKLGASGEDVKTLQSLLNKAGFSLAEDGVYGQKTAAAVVDYQTANRLTANGIADEDLWTRLGGAPGDTARQAQAAQDYDPDETAQSAAKVAYLENNAPGAYVSPYTEQIDQLLTRVLGRDAFDYEPDGDPAYGRYRDQYVYNARRAREDAVGDAAAQTGGYGNSYAAAAGDQAYQHAMMQFSDQLPELYQLALSAYDARGKALTDAIDALSEREDTGYRAHQDETKAYKDALTYYYQKLQDERAQENWQTEFDRAGAKKTSSSGRKAQTGGEAAVAAPVADMGKTAAAAPVANTKKTAEKSDAGILTQSEFTRRKAAGAASLQKYADYAAYRKAMLG